MLPVGAEILLGSKGIVQGEANDYKRQCDCVVMVHCKGIITEQKRPSIYEVLGVMVKPERTHVSSQHTLGHSEATISLQRGIFYACRVSIRRERETKICCFSPAETQNLV